MVAPPSSRAWWLLTALSLLAGFGWRAAHVDNRPLHADEAVQAWQTWHLLDGDGYRYDPLDRHGPSLYYGAAALHRLTGGTAATFDDHAARRFVLVAGVATLLLFAFAPRAAGFDPLVGVFAVALLACETLSTLYHTYFVQEAWLALLVWAFFFLLLRRWQNQEAPTSTSSWFVLGLLAGIAQTTKEVTPIYLALAVGAAWFAHRHRGTKPTRPRLAAFGWFLVGFAPPVLLLYSSFGQNPTGLLDAFRTYVLQFQRLDAGSHNYPWTQILRYLGLASTGPIYWGQTALLLAALIGSGLALSRTAAPAHRATALFTWALLVLHTVIGYKTPWLLLTPMLGLVLLAAHSLAAQPRRFPRFGSVAAILLTVLIGAQSYAKSWLALDRYAGDARNPYFYEQTPRAFTRLPARLAELQAHVDRPLRVAVVSPEDAWPLPWYWRGHDTVGYFATAPADLASWDLVVWDSQLGEPPDTLTASDRVVEFAGLRPNVILTVSIARPVWAATFPPAP